MDDVRGTVDGLMLERRNLRDQVKDVILARIVEGEYAPGQRLVETQIARELSCSQAPVREALRDLEQLGIVLYEPNRGCSVRAVSVGELLEGYPVRAALEGLAAEEAATRITPDELDALESHLEDMRRCARQGDAQEQAHANVRFHAGIVTASRNRALARQWQLIEPTARTYITILASDVDLMQLAERHVPILDALREGNAPVAASHMSAHLLEAAEFLRAARPEQLGGQRKPRSA